MKKIIIIGCLLTILASCLVSLAQEQTKKKIVTTAKTPVQIEVAETISIDERSSFAFNEEAFTFISAEGGFGGKTVKGAPYSADAVSENIQVLHDGNRIVRKNTSSVARDSEGRTRQEQTFRSIGPYAAAGDPPQTFSINDPVAGVHFMLDQRSKTAHKMMIRVDRAGSGDTVVYTTGTGDEGTSVRTIDVRGKRRPLSKGMIENGVMSIERLPGAERRIEIRTGGKPENLKTEALGKQTIEGVEAEGTRTTFTIPAGEIGNELPINVVNEVWYSPELKVVVLRKHSDPRQGEMNYRLTNINRAEPARSLFEVPADYTVKEPGAPGMRMKIEREMVREKKNLKEKNEQ